MSTSSSRSFSACDLTRRGSAGSISSSDFKGFKPKGGDLAQAMLSEIEDLLKEYDSDMAKLFGKSHYSRAWAEPTSADGAKDLQSANAAVGEPTTAVSPAKLDYAGQYLAKQPWARRDSQLWRLLTGEICSATGNDQLDLESLKSVIRNVYRLVVSDMAPKLQGLMNEVIELRKQYESVSNKLEQQRETNHTQMEELEELQSKLRAKERELNEHKQASKTLDIFEGENAALKMEVKSLRTLVEKQEQQRVSRDEERAPQKVAEVVLVKTLSSEWLKQKNTDLEREVSRWRAENAEKETTISELREVIKNMSAVESPRNLPPRKLSTSLYRPESFLGPASLPTRSLGDSPALDFQVGAALNVETPRASLDTPRGRFRSVIMDSIIHNSPPSAERSLKTLAEDLKMPARSGLKRRSVQLLMPTSENKPGTAGKGTLSPPPTVRFATSDEVKKNISSASPENTSTGKKAGQEWCRVEQFQTTAEVMERALFELEDLKATWTKKGVDFQEKGIWWEQLLREAEEQINLLTKEAEGAKNERDNAMTKYRSTAEVVEGALFELEDLKATWGRKGIEWQEKAVRWEQLLMQAEERADLSTKEAEKAKNERDNAMTKYGSAAEAVESALFELEDMRATWGRKGTEWQEKVARWEQLLMHAEERVNLLTTKAEGAKNERDNAMTKYRSTAEVMESALFELEDMRATWGKKGAEWQEKATRCEQLLMQAEERTSLLFKEAEGAENEKDNAMRKYRSTHEELVRVTAELHRALCQVAHLQSTLEMMEGTVEKVQRQASKVTRRLNEILSSAENKVDTLQKKIAVLESQVVSKKEVARLPKPESASDTKLIPKPESIPRPVVPEKPPRKPSLSRTAVDEDDSNVLQVIETPLLPEPLLPVYRKQLSHCSPTSCFNLWDISKPCKPPPKPIYSHELAKSIQARMWYLRNVEKIKN